MKARSLDLQEWMAAACAEPKATHPAVADRFYISVSFVEKLRQWANGSMAALPRRCGPTPLLNVAARTEVMACPHQ